MPTNFQQFNPNANNQLTDSQYTSDTMRSGGAVAGLCASNSFNKFAFQTSTFVSALAQVMSNKGYTVSDANLAALVTSLSNIITVADTGSIAAASATNATNAANATATGTIPYCRSENGLRIIRGTVNNGSISHGSGFSVVRNSTGNYTVTFATAFSDVPSVALSVFGTGISTINRGSFSPSSLNVIINSDNIFDFIAIGPN